MNTTKDKIIIMQAYVDNKRIEYRHKDFFHWSLTTEPVWNWNECEYRIHPEDCNKQTPEQIIKALNDELANLKTENENLRAKNRSFVGPSLQAQKEIQELRDSLGSAVADVKMFATIHDDLKEKIAQLEVELKESKEKEFLSSQRAEKVQSERMASFGRFQDLLGGCVLTGWQPEVDLEIEDRIKEVIGQVKSAYDIIKIAQITTQDASNRWKYQGYMVPKAVKDELAKIDNWIDSYLKSPLDSKSITVKSVVITQSNQSGWKS